MHGSTPYTPVFAYHPGATGSFIFQAVASNGTEQVITLTEEEEERIMKNRNDIAKGKARGFKNAEEYLKSLEEDN